MNKKANESRRCENKEPKFLTVLHPDFVLGNPFLLCLGCLGIDELVGKLDIVLESRP
jgi:hypothetical protein